MFRGLNEQFPGRYWSRTFQSEKLATIKIDASRFRKMHGFSTVDGFVEITECLAEMIKYVANEPSAGLFYIQQHTQNAVPNVISLGNKVAGKSHEITLHNEDLEDSITMVRSMKHCGLPIADDMSGDIKKSLAIMSTKQPKKGVIQNSTTGFQAGSSSFSGPSSWSHGILYNPQDGERRGNYFKNVFKSAKQKASNFKWPNLDLRDPPEGEKPQLYPSEPLPLAATSSSSSLQEVESDELPVSSRTEDELQDEKGENQSDISTTHHRLSLVAEDYEDFKANREAKLEEWLEGNGNHDKRSITQDVE